MSENIINTEPEVGSELKNRDFVDKIRVYDKDGMVHEFLSTTELMEWQKESRPDRNNP